MSIYEIVFSPTGGTARVAKAIAEGFGGGDVSIDLCDAGADLSQYAFSGKDLALIAMPSFGGRAPAVAIERLKQLKGNGARCVIVCAYGNRAYEDTLVEMEDAAKDCGFRVVAAIAAVAEHSIMPQYATGRPCASDVEQLKGFAKRVMDKTGVITQLPGNRPYKKSGGAGLVPKVSKDCVKCGLCAKACPVQAIDPATFTTNGKACISCMRCVKQCPEKARKVNGALVSVAALAIKKACSVRKENELYL